MSESDGKAESQPQDEQEQEKQQEQEQEQDQQHQDEENKPDDTDKRSSPTVKWADKDDSEIDSQDDTAAPQEAEGSGSAADTKGEMNTAETSSYNKAREQTYMPTTDDTQRECTCSDQDFVRLIASDSSVLCKTINRWQESYKLDVNDLKEKALRLIKGDFRDLYGDLDPEEQVKIEREIARLQRERTELLMGAIGRLAKENTLT